MKAIVEIGGKDWTVSEKDIIAVPHLASLEQKEFKIEKVKALIQGKKSQFGKPYLEQVEVRARVLEEKKGKKILVFKYKSKSNYRRKRGYRDKLTVVQIESIKVAGEKLS